MFTIHQISKDHRDRRFKRQNEIQWCSMIRNQVHFDDGVNQSKRELTDADLKAEDWIFEELVLELRASDIEQVFIDQKWNVDTTLRQTGNELMATLIDELGFNA